MLNTLLCGFYVVKVYAEKASGRTADRPALKEMLADLQVGEFVINVYTGK